MNNARKTADDIINVVVIAIVPVMEMRKSKFLFVKEPDGALRFPGGKVKLHESLTEALQRELFEETGMETVMPNAIAMIEHSILYNQKKDEIEKSILLYIFLASLRESLSRNEDQPFTLMDGGLVTSQHSRIPYDNYLIINNMRKIKKEHRYRVPPGFLDSRKDEEIVAIRNFCWIDPELQRLQFW